MKRIFTFILPLLAMLLPVDADAQYDRNYIYWVGRQCMMENNYREAIDVLSVLIRFDERHTTPTSTAASPNTTSTIC